MSSVYNEPAKTFIPMTVGVDYNVRAFIVDTSGSYTLVSKAGQTVPFTLVAGVVYPFWITKVTVAAGAVVGFM